MSDNRFLLEFCANGQVTLNESEHDLHKLYMYSTTKADAIKFGGKIIAYQKIDINKIPEMSNSERIWCYGTTEAIFELFGGKDVS